MKRRSALLTVLLLWCSAAGLASDTRDERLSRVSASLMCVCGCPHILNQCGDECGLAPQLTNEMAQLLQSGKTEQEIVRIFEERYGARIHAAPKAEGFNLLAWVLPFVGLAAGAAVVVIVARNLKPDTTLNRKTQMSPEIEEKYKKLIERELRE